MVNYFIYAKDYSASTEGFEHFHTNGLKTYEEFKSYVDKINQELILNGETPTESKIVYLHWGEECFEVDENETVSSYKTLRGGAMGTEPQTIIQWIQKNCNISDENNKIKLLYIVTDGLTDNSSADECFVLNDNMNYETVVFHAFNTDLDAIDLSVASSFLKNHCKIYRNYELYDNINIAENFDYEKIKLDNFETEKDSLISYIRLKFIKQAKNDASALQEIEKLKKLKNRLLAELLSKSPQEKVDLETKGKNKFLCLFNTRWYQNLIKPGKNTKVDTEKFISTLINYIASDQRCYSFNVLKS